jgi:hypothetical protein
MTDKPSIRFRPVHQALLIQLAALFFTSTTKDGGVVFDACILASALFWAFCGLLLIWHHRYPSPLFPLFLRWGLLFVAPLGTMAFEPSVRLVLGYAD